MAQNQVFVRTDQFISRNYLTNLSKNEIVDLNAEGFEKLIASNIRLLQLDLLVFNPEKNINDELVSVFSALAEATQDKAILALIIDSKGSENDESVKFYFGIYTSNTEVGTSSQVLLSGIRGSFPGSKVKMLNDNETRFCLNSIKGRFRRNPSVACLTVLPAPRDESKNRSVQGIDRFIEKMKGQKYTAIILASSVKKEIVDERKKSLEQMYKAISPYSQTSFSYGQNESTAVAYSISKTTSQSLANGISKTFTSSSFNSVSRGEGKSRTSGSSGNSWSTSTAWNSNISYSEGSSSAKSDGTSETKTVGISDTAGKNESETKGSSITYTIVEKNKFVENLLLQLDQAIERINRSASYGLWSCAAYFISENIQITAIAANAYKGVVVGDKNKKEDSHINYWNYEDSKKILNYLVEFKHPQFYYDNLTIDSTCFVSGNELPLLIGLPRKTVLGVTVESIAEFGRQVSTLQDFSQKKSEASERKTIFLGNVLHMREKEKTKVELDLNTFSSHCFITGSTGSGKSNTTYHLLEEFIKNKIPFLVIEPAKGEYRNAFANVPDIKIFTTNLQYNRLLRINPFRFQPSIHILEHLDRLIEIFNCCWEMMAAMPSLLKLAIEQCYIAKGWDLANSISLEAEPIYPTFQDLLEILPKVIEQSGYSAEAQSDYKGALVSRVSSLTNGIFGQVLCNKLDLLDEELFDKNVIIDLSRVGSTESKALLMGILVIRLTEYRLAKAEGANSELRHITVLEEAHNLLKRSDQHSSKLTAKAVGMICNSIAEMRTFGEGFIIVDQSPGAVDIAAIKNTNTKIIMKLPDKNDAETIGAAFGLNKYQILEIPRLRTGDAIVMQSNWLTAVLTLISRYPSSEEAKEYEDYSQPVSREDMRRIHGIIVYHILNDIYFKGGKTDEDKVIPENFLENIDIEIDDFLKSKKLNLTKLQSKEYLSYFYSYFGNKKNIKNVDIGKIILDLLKCDLLVKRCLDCFTQSKNFQDYQFIQEWLSALREFKKFISIYCEISEGNQGYHQTFMKLLILGSIDANSSVGKKSAYIIKNHSRINRRKYSKEK